MKKLTAIFLLLIIMLCGCSKQPKDKNQASQSGQNATNQNSSQNKSDSIDNLAELFLSVLKSNQKFYSIERNSDIFIADLQKSIWSFCTVDMDDDNNGEVAVMFNDGNILILRQNGESVTGYSFGLHAMYQINEDGSFLWNRDAGNVYGCSKLKFSDKGYETTELWRVETDSTGATTYYVENKSVSKESFEAATTQKNKKSIMWNAWKDAS